MKLHLIGDEFFPYEMMLDVNVLSAAMIDHIVRVIDGALVIDVECGWSQVQDSEFACKGL